MTVNAKMKHCLKQNIMKKILIAVSFVFASFFNLFSEDDLVVKPIYEFKSGNLRNPFLPRQFGKMAQGEEYVHISALKLKGITFSGNSKSAMFVSIGGSDFNYLLIDGVFYGENNKEISEITGEVKNNFEAVLRQGDKEILYRLEKPVNENRFRPE